MANESTERHLVWRQLLRVSALVSVVCIAILLPIFGPDPFFIGIGVLILVGVIVTRWKARIGAVVILVPSLVLALFAGGSIVFVAAHAISFYELANGVGTVLSLAAIVSVIAAVATLLERWVGPIRSARAPMVVGSLAVLMVLVIAAVGAPSRLGYGNASASSGDNRLQMKDTKYSTQSLDSGQAVSVYVTNSDPSAHTFTIDGVVDQTVPANSTGKVTLTLKPGRYHYYCSVPGHSDTMHGTLTVH